MVTVIVVGGPAGTGKTTQGVLLSQYYQCPFIEGDQLHPQSNIDKMSRGEALTDEDRWGWLAQISKVASTKAQSDPSHLSVVSCSMLKRKYREYIKQQAAAAGGGGGPDIKFRFVFLYTNFDELMERVGARVGHFMKSDMVRSQYEIMEIPHGGELLQNGGEAVAVDTSGKSRETIFKEVLGDFELPDEDKRQEPVK
ncbi:uncharacterized protein LODBEIA_P43690 [Lodderomyces beijingensis]|uniref:Gluconokinase n=1 Tax=Lodderomyces beijingensis TaxID=1775926 RepID=A0ABP0ZSF1_9ASCO